MAQSCEPSRWQHAMRDKSSRSCCCTVRTHERQIMHSIFQQQHVPSDNIREFVETYPEVFAWTTSVRWAPPSQCAALDEVFRCRPSEHGYVEIQDGCFIVGRHFANDFTDLHMCLPSPQSPAEQSLTSHGTVGWLVCLGNIARQRNVRQTTALRRYQNIDCVADTAKVLAFSSIETMWTFGTAAYFWSE